MPACVARCFPRFTPRRSLADSQATVRALAAEALIRGGGVEGRAAVRKLLTEDVTSVRLRVALAMARAGERERYRC